MNPDVLIVGGSYAGIAAGLILARARRPVTVIDAGLPRNRFASHSHGVLGLDGTSGAELLKTARQQLLDYPTVRWVHAEAVQATTLDQLGAEFARHLAHHRSLEGHHES